jgi:hypothetical protein
MNMIKLVRVPIQYISKKAIELIFAIFIIIVIKMLHFSLFDDSITASCYYF